MVTSATTGSRPTARPATIAEWLAEPEERGAELIGGRIVYKASPSFAHGRVQRKLGVFLDPFDRGPNGPGAPGGWWIGNEVDIELGENGLRPDVAGWRRDRVPIEPKAEVGRGVTVRPDWVCEVLSTSNAAHDLGKKLSLYHRAGVPHYWILDPKNATLAVYRHSPDAYLAILGAGRDDVVRAEPFDALELRIADLFGDGSDPVAP